VWHLGSIWVFCVAYYLPIWNGVMTINESKYIDMPKLDFEIFLFCFRRRDIAHTQNSTIPWRTVQLVGLDNKVNSFYTLSLSIYLTLMSKPWQGHRHEKINLNEKVNQHWCQRLQEGHDNVELIKMNRKFLSDFPSQNILICQSFILRYFLSGYWDIAQTQNSTILCRTISWTTDFPHL
jgi:hypothetical protein